MNDANIGRPFLALGKLFADWRLLDSSGGWKTDGLEYRVSRRGSGTMFLAERVERSKVSDTYVFDLAEQSSTFQGLVRD